MLDLSGIRVVDNHCHPVLLMQEMDALRFRSYFTEATHPSFAQTHLPNTIYYLWILHQIATFYGCDCSEDAILATRNRIPAASLIHRLVQAAQIDTLILDIKRVHFMCQRCIGLVPCADEVFSARFYKK